MQTTDLTTFDLQAPPDAGTAPRPYGVVVNNGRVYVAFANLAGFSATGPGLVAVLDITTDGGAAVPHTFADGGVLQPVAPDAARCLNAGALLLAGTTLYVACGPHYDANFAIDVPGAVGALDISGDVPQPLWTTPLGCPADAGADCAPGAASRMAIAGGKLYVGDFGNGRLFILDPTSGALTAGPANALNLCLAPDGGFQEISDVAARP